MKHALNEPLHTTSQMIQSNERIQRYFHFVLFSI